jgi:hypothetical protein
VVVHHSSLAVTEGEGLGPRVLGTAYERWRADARKRRLVFEKWSCCLGVLERGLLVLETHAVEFKFHSRRLRPVHVTAITAMIRRILAYSNLGFLYLPQPFHSRASLAPNSFGYSQWSGKGCKGGKGPNLETYIR